MLYAYLAGRMGYAVADGAYRSAQVRVGDFCFFAGEPDARVAAWQPENTRPYTILIPRTPDWRPLIEQCYPQARLTERYAFAKKNAFQSETSVVFAQVGRILQIGDIMHEPRCGFVCRMLPNRISIRN